MNFLLKLARAIFMLYFIVYGLFHVLMLLMPEKVVHYCIFHNYVYNPFTDLTNPTKSNLNNVHNFYMDIEPEVRVGIWHFIPSPLEYSHEHHSKRTIKKHFEKYFKIHDNRPILIYAHGSDRERGNYLRVANCLKVTEMGYHVFAIDYRGYGDSTGTPSEKGVVNDVLTLYNFIKSYQNRSRVFLWGHSLGAGVVSHAAKILSDFKSPPAGVLLEAPFFNVSRASRDFFGASLFLNNKWVINRFDEALENIGLRMANGKHVSEINSRILIVHAEDDMLIPHQHSRDLVAESDLNRPKHYPQLRYIELDKKHRLNHAWIMSHEEIFPSIREWIEA